MFLPPLRFLLVDMKGYINGMNKSMFQVFQKHSDCETYEFDSFKNLNIFYLMPQLKNEVKKKIGNVADSQSRKNDLNDFRVISDFFIPKEIRGVFDELESRKILNSSDRQKSEYFSISHTMRAHSLMNKNLSSRTGTQAKTELSFIESLNDVTKSVLLRSVVSLNYFMHRWSEEKEDFIEYIYVEFEQLRKARDDQIEMMKKKRIEFQRSPQNSDGGESYHLEMSQNLSQDLQKLQDNPEKFVNMPGINTTRLLPAQLLMPPTPVENPTIARVSFTDNRNQERAWTSKSLEECEEFNRGKSFASGDGSGMLPVVKELGKYL
jgi:hypothetical protein